MGVESEAARIHKGHWRRSATWPVAAGAQQAERMRRIGALTGLAESDPIVQPMVAAFEGALAKLGWTRGRNVRIEYRWARRCRHIRRHAAELAALAPDVIFLQAPRRRAVAASDPHRAGRVRGCPRSSRLRLRRQPGAAGRQRHRIYPFEFSLSGKWLELLKEIAPGVTRAAVFGIQP